MWRRLRSCFVWPVLIGVIASVTIAAHGWAQHPAINLYDKEMNEINPITGENADVPFSIEQTCGACHDYETITEGYHFQMGWDTISDDYGVEEGRPWRNHAYY